MGFFSRLLSGTTGNIVTLNGIYTADPTEAPSVNETEALSVAGVFNAVRMISQAVAATPFTLNQRESRNNRVFRKEIIDHPAWRLVNQRPNPVQTRSAFIESVLLNASLGNGALVYIVRDSQGKPTELWPVAAGTYAYQQRTDGTMSFTVNLATGGQGALDDRDAMWIHGPALDGQAAAPLLGAARRTLGIASALERTQKDSADRAGAPRGIVSVDAEGDKQLTPEQREAFKKTLAANFAAGKSGMMASYNDVKFTALSENFNNQQFLAQREFIAKSISDLFLIPATMILGGKPTDVDLTLYNQNAIRPWIIRLEEAFNKYLLNDSLTLAFNADEHAHMRSDPQKQIDFLIKALGSGGTPAIISQNEARVFLGWNPVDNDAYDTISLGGYANDSGLNDSEKPVK